MRTSCDEVDSLSSPLCLHVLRVVTRAHTKVIGYSRSGRLRKKSQRWQYQDEHSHRVLRHLGDEKQMLDSWQAPSRDACAHTLCDKLSGIKRKYNQMAEETGQGCESWGGGDARSGQEDDDDMGGCADNLRTETVPKKRLREEGGVVSQHESHESDDCNQMHQGGALDGDTADEDQNNSGKHANMALDMLLDVCLAQNGHARKMVETDCWGSRGLTAIDELADNEMNEEEEEEEENQDDVSSTYAVYEASEDEILCNIALKMQARNHRMESCSMESGDPILTLRRRVIAKSLRKDFV